MRLQTLMPLVCFLFSGVHASEIGRVTHITYTSPNWNTDSTKIDTAALFLRDKNSGKIVQVQLEETEPDSSQFIGQFSLSIGQGEKSTPEVYVPPQELRASDPDHKKLLEMIPAGKLGRRPLIWKKNEHGEAVLSVYDTREQAEAGLAAYQAEMKLAQEARHKKTLKPATPGAVAESGAAAAHHAQLDKLATEATKRSQDRVQMEALERQKAEERKRKEEQLTAEERAKRKALAVQASTEAQDFYAKGDYVHAETKFKQASELDPTSKDYYYKYGVTLYRNQKYNDALVALKLAKVESAQELERKYYTGLVYYRLPELDNALAAFIQVGKSTDPTLGPSATFYEGVILFTQEKYEECKKSFERVIDASQDPRLDEQAESYLDKVAGAMAYKKLRENKFTLMAMIGISYDSNVLSSPDNTPAGSAPTNKADFRLLTLADLQFRPIFSEKREFAPHATINLTNSAKAESAKADPFIYTVAAPFTWSTQLSKKAYRLTLNPGYELLYLDPTGTGTKTKEMSSYYLGIDQTLSMRKDWVSTYSLEYRHDKSDDPTSVGPNDLSGTKYTFRTIQTFMLDKALKQALMPMIGYSRDSAVGSTKSYNRYDAGITYARPIPWSMGWNVGLAYYRITYPGTSNPTRTDSDYSFTTGITKPIKDWIIWGVTGNYTKNSSNDPNSQYSKFLILTTATFLTNF